MKEKRLSYCKFWKCHFYNSDYNFNFNFLLRILFNLGFGLQIILDTLSHAHIQKACKEKKKDPKKMSSETRKQVVKDEQRRQGIITFFIGFLGVDHLHFFRFENVIYIISKYLFCFQIAVKSVLGFFS